MIFRLRSPALITTSAVITLVMLAIGSSVFRSRLHSTWPVPATAMAAALASTPLGPVTALARAAPARTSLAAEGGAVTVSARQAARIAAPTHPDARTAR